MVRCIDAKRLLFNRESVLGTRGRKRAPKGNWIKSMVLIATLVDWHNSTLCQSASLRIPNSFRLLVQNSCRPHGLNWQAATQQKQDFLETVLVVERAPRHFFPEIEKKQLEIIKLCDQNQTSKTKSKIENLGGGWGKTNKSEYSIYVDVFAIRRLTVGQQCPPNTSFPLSCIKSFPALVNSK
jgi:hypothetical protein